MLNIKQENKMFYKHLQSICEYCNIIKVYQNIPSQIYYLYTVKICLNTLVVRLKSNCLNIIITRARKFM